MTVDFDKILKTKAAVEAQLSRGKGGGGAKFWVPSNGKNRIRILPGWDTSGEFTGQFWLEVHQHWQVSESQRGPILCALKTPHLSGKCPICEFIDQLKAKGGPAAESLAYEIRPKRAYFLNVVDLKDPKYTEEDLADWEEKNPDRDPPFEIGDPKLQVYAAPVTVFDQILGTMANTRKDITQLVGGRDVFLIKHYNKKDVKLTRYETTIDLDPSDAPVDEDVEITDLTTVSRVMDYDAALKVLAEGVGAGHDLALTAGASAGALGAGDDTVEDDDDDMSVGDDDLADLEKSMMEAIKGKKK